MVPLQICAQRSDQNTTPHKFVPLNNCVDSTNKYGLGLASKNLWRIGRDLQIQMKRTHRGTNICAAPLTRYQRNAKCQQNQPRFPSSQDWRLFNIELMQLVDNSTDSNELAASTWRAYPRPNQQKSIKCERCTLAHEAAIFQARRDTRNELIQELKQIYLW